MYSFTILFGLQFAFIHYLAEQFELYWRYPWLDMPMHVFGGIFIMLTLASLARMRVMPQWCLSSWRLVVVLTGVLVGWELFGIYRYGGLKPDFWSDGLLDLLCGTLGVVIGHYLAKSITKI